MKNLIRKLARRLGFLHEREVLARLIKAEADSYNEGVIDGGHRGYQLGFKAGLSRPRDGRGRYRHLR